MSTPTDETLFARALELPFEERAAFLKQACGEDGSRRARIESLLAALREAEHDFLETNSAVTSLAIPHEVIGSYKLLQKIGEGGCGVVYMAEQERPVRRRVALKIIKLGMDTQEVVARFEAERQAIAMMDHPNIAKMLDAGATTAGRPYFVMELVRGVQITKYCDERNLSTRARLELFTQVCYAVQHAHQKGVIHRDLKPSNILVTLHDGTPVPKVIDFGIAKATQGRLTDATLFTAFEQFIGTPAYMSPEQAEMSALDIDTRSDIYTLGVLLYELLTGRPPFDPHTLVSAGLNEIRRIIREVEPPRPSTRLGTMAAADLSTVARARGTAPSQLSTLLRGDLDWIVMRCLEKDRTRRYATANELALDILCYLRDEPVTARPPSAAYRLRKTIRRHRAGFIAGVLVASTLLIGTVVSLEQAVRAHRAERIAYVEAETSAAISNFLQHDLLGELAAERQPSREVTLRAVLDRAAQKMDTAFADQPLIEVSLRDTVGRIYHSLGDYAAMQRHMERALELGLRWRKPDDIHTLESMAGLAEAFRAQGKLIEAQKHFAETLVRQERTLGPEHRETLISMNGLSMTYRGLGRYAEAAELLERTLAIQQRVLSAKHAEEMLSTMNSLGLAYLALGRLPQAAATIERALEERKRLFDLEHPDTMSSLHCLAQVRRGQGRIEEAAQLAEQAAALQKRVLGLAHPMALRGLSGLAVIYRAQGRLAEAAALGSETLARQQAAIGADNPDTIETMHQQGITLRENRRLAEARELLERALALRRTKLGTQHPDFAATLGELGHVLLALREAVAAEPILREAIVWHESRPDSRAALPPLRGLLGAALAAERRFTEAEPLLHSAAETLRQNPSTSSGRPASAWTLVTEGLIELCLSRNDPEQAEYWRARLRDLAPAGSP